MSRSILSREFLGAFISDMNIQDTSNIHDLERYIEMALEIMCIPNFMVYKPEIKEVKGNRAVLPCDEGYLQAVLLDNNCYVENDSPSYVAGLSRLIIRNNPYIGIGVQLGQMNNAYGTINGNFLETTFATGKVLFIYKGLPTDCDGNSLIPNDPNVYEALRFYLLYNLGLGGIKTRSEIGWREANQYWEKLYPRAANNVNWFTPQEYQEFTEMWNNIFVGDISNSIV